jgi:putative tryptophan/tyrosine transport system substrate-binding protein
VKRREFIAGLGAAAWPIAVRAQQPDRMRRIGVLMGTSDSDPDILARLGAFRQGLAALGWIEGRNIHIDYRWAMGDADRARTGATELLRLAPDMILVTPVLGLATLQQATRTIPIVFVQVSEPVAQGFVSSLARPGGNITGFSNLEPTMGARWLQLLKEIAPHITRAAIMLNPDTSPFMIAFFRSAEAAAPKFAVEATFAPVHEIAQIESVMTALGRERGGGLIVPTDTFALAHSNLIVELAARLQIPAIYGLRTYPAVGGLVSYGVDAPDMYRRSAGYVDRILRGEKPADLPVQRPTKFELVINAKTAKALGLIIPETLLATADEVIE